METYPCNCQDALRNPQQAPHLNRLAQFFPHLAFERINRGFAKLDSAPRQDPRVACYNISVATIV